MARLHTTEFPEKLLLSSPDSAQSIVLQNSLEKKRLKPRISRPRFAWKECLKPKILIDLIDR